MKLRTALKIIAAVGTERETLYSDGKVGKALQRVERTRTAKLSQQYWEQLMRIVKAEKFSLSQGEGHGRR